MAALLGHVDARLSDDSSAEGSTAAAAILCAFFYNHRLLGINDLFAALCSLGVLPHAPLQAAGLRTGRFLSSYLPPWTYSESSAAVLK